MVAPKKNSFWKLRATHAGPAKLFASPDVLWDSACEYFQHCVDNPLQAVEYSNGKRVSVPKMQAFTWSGLELYLDIYSMREYKTNPKYKKFFPIIAKIDKVIYTQKFVGAAAGFLNPSIIARDLGLVDKQQLAGDPDKPMKTDLTIRFVNSGPPPASSEKELDLS